MKSLFVSSVALCACVLSSLGVTPADYTRHIEFEASHASLAEATLSGFPVLVRLSEDIPGFRYSDFRQPNGADLLFVDAENNALPHEVDTWNPNGESLLWVRVPSLTQGTTLHAWYRGPANTAASTDTWQDYAGVWHFAEASGTAYDSTANLLHGTPSGTAAESMIATDGVIGTARVNAPSKSYLSIPSYDSLALGNTFTVSAWFNAYNINGYPRFFSRKNNYKDDNGWEIQANNSSKVKISTRGSKDTSFEVTIPDWNANWVFLTFVYNGTTASVYTNGFFCGSGTIRAATDNGRPLSIGSNSNGSETAINGRFDEARLHDGNLAPAWIAAEYATVADPAFLTASEATSASADTPILEPTADLALVDGTWTFSATLNEGIGDVYAVLHNLSADTVTTQLVASAQDATSGPIAISAPLTLDPGALYAAAAFSLDALNDGTDAAVPHTVFAGEVTIAASADVLEASMTPGAFTVSRPDTPAATVAALTIPYTLSGTALPGETIAPLSGTVTIPVGEATATLTVPPLFCPTITTDTSLTVTLVAESCYIGTPGSATISVINAEETLVRYVAPDGSDLNSGLTPSAPFASIATAVDSLAPVATPETPGTVYVAPGTYTETAADSAIVITNAIHVLGTTENPADVIVTRSTKSARVFFINHPNARLQYLTVRNGEALQGTSLYMDTQGGEVLDCVIADTANSTWNAVGAFLMKNGYVARCVFTNNSVRAGAAALRMEGGLAESCLFVKNACRNAHTVELANTGTTLLNSTIVGNSGGGSAGVRAGNNTRVVNCAIFNNVAPDTTYGKVWAGTASSFIHCAADLEIPGGINCIVGDPLFLGPAEGDYRIELGSCCFDAGVDTATYNPQSETDLDRLPRLSGPAIDIGCYEYQQDDIALGYSIESESYIAPSTIRFIPSIVGLPADATPTLTWDFQDGTTQSTVGIAPVEHTYARGGDYPVTLTLDWGNDTATYVPITPVHVSPAILYVSGDNPDAAAPYDTPETGAPSVATAVAYAENGATILILPGTLTQQGETNVEKGLRILGSTGDPNDVILSNDQINGYNCRIFILNHPDAFVANLTMTRGAAGHGANVYFKVGGGTVSNCVIRSGRSHGYDTNGAAAYILNGLLTHTEITGEFLSEPDYGQDPTRKGIVVHLDGANARMENCLIHDISLIKNNKPESTCGAIASANQGTIAHCTIAPNCALPQTTYGNASYANYKGGSALHCGDKGNAYNCVATGLLNTNGVLTAFSGTPSRFTACAGDSEELWPGNNCIQGSAASFYRDAANQDYRPAQDSPLVNTGHPIALASTTDLLGKPRIIDNHPDIGCYEADTRRTLILFR